jgi:hypothetical protein
MIEQPEGPGQSGDGFAPLLDVGLLDRAEPARGPRQVLDPRGVGLHQPGAAAGTAETRWNARVSATPDLLLRGTGEAIRIEGRRSERSGNP